MQKRKNFISRNDKFTCSFCKKEVAALNKGCRNHCPSCLYSLHTDKDVPGDRLSSCEGLMIADKIDYSSKKGYILIHRCLKCGKISKNKCAKDDDVEKIILLTQRGYVLKTRKEDLKYFRR